MAAINLNYYGYFNENGFDRIWTIIVQFEGNGEFVACM